MTPDLSYHLEGGREESEDNKWDEKIIGGLNK